MLFTPQKSYMGGCFKTMVFFFRGPFPRNWIQLHRIWFAEWHGIPQALLLLLVLPMVWTFPMTPVTFLQGPLRAWCATRKRACRPPRNWSDIPLLPGGSSEPSVSEQYLLVVQPLGKNYIYSLYSLYTLSKHLWRATPANLFQSAHDALNFSIRFDQLIPWTLIPALAAPLQKANNSRMACMVVLLKLESPCQYARELQRNHPYHLYCPPSDPSLGPKESPPYQPNHQLAAATGIFNPP